MRASSEQGEGRPRTFGTSQTNVTGTYGEKQKASGRSLAREEVVSDPNMLLKNKNKKHNPARG
jgi:hypothetical protein